MKLASFIGKPRVQRNTSPQHQFGNLVRTNIFWRKMYNTYRTDHTQLVDVWGKWLLTWKWEWFGTFTFRFPVGEWRAQRSWDMLIKEMEAETHDRVHYVRAAEQNRFRGAVPHYHALMLGVRNLNPSSWQRYWGRIGGIARIEPYNPGDKAPFYLSKYAGTPDENIVFSKGIEFARDRRLAA